LERGLPAKNDNAVRLFNRVDRFAGKPGSNKRRISPVGAWLAREER
jgi:hypothetical protein